MNVAPRRALRLDLELEADSVPRMIANLIALMHTIHDMGRMGTLPKDRQAAINDDGADGRVRLQCDPLMTPERYRCELAAHRQEDRRG